MLLFKKKSFILFFTILQCCWMYRTWGVKKNDTQFEYFSQFVESMANITVDRLYPVMYYEDDERLRDLNLRELVEFVRILSFSGKIYYDLL